MKITRLKIESLGPFARAGVAFDQPVTAIFGRNGAGKTTLTRAIEALLRAEVHAFQGRALTPGALANGPALVEGTVTVAPGREVTISRHLDGKRTGTRINGKPSPNAVFDFFAPRGMDDPDGVFRVLLNVSGFLDRADAEQKSLLMSLVAQDIPPEMLAGLPMEGRVDPPKTLRDLAVAYKQSFDERAVAKKQLAAIRVPPAPTLPRQDTAKIWDKVELLQSQERAMTASLGAQGGERKALEAERERLVKSVGGTEKLIADLGDHDAIAQKIAALTAELADLEAGNARVISENAERATRARNLDKFREMDRGLAGLGAVCVLGSEIPCPLSLDKRAELRQSFAQHIATLEKHLRNAPEIPLHKTAGVEKKIAQAQGTLRNMERLKGELLRLRNEVTRLDEKISALPAEAETPSTLVELRLRIRNGTDALNEAVRVNVAHDERERFLAAHGKAQAEVDAWEALVAAFGPKGIVERILPLRLSALSEKLNAVLAPFGLSLIFSAEPWSLLVNGRHPLLLSASERFRAGIAFQIALGEITGTRFVVIDGIDVLDKENRDALFSLLRHAVEDKRIAQAIVTATLTNSRALAGPFPDGMGVFLIHRGAISPVIPPTT